MTTCTICDDALAHCHATSIDHLDGTTECLGDDPCELAHHLHEWTITCAEEFDLCGCRSVDALAVAA